MMKDKGLVLTTGYHYIASPYSTKANKGTRDHRYHVVKDFTAWCIQREMIVYSPIVHCHVLAETYSLPYDMGYWHVVNKNMLLAGGRLIVLTLDGWWESRGVQSEIALAHEHELPVSYARILALFDDPRTNDYELSSQPPTE